jgi:hypothetical protein
VEERYERVMLSTTTALGALLHSLGDQALAQGPSEAFAELAKPDGTAWRLLEDSRPNLRRAAYSLVAAVSAKLAPLIRQNGQVGEGSGTRGWRSSTAHIR